METIKVNMSPNPLDVQTIHASQNDGEARQWEFELHNNGELIDTSDVKEQLVFKAYKGGTEQILPENTSTPTTSPFKGDIRYPQGLLTDQEFTYRQSPTEEDGLAKITDIKGNTLNWNQQVETLITTQDYEGVTFTNNGDGSLTINGTTTNTSVKHPSIVANNVGADGWKASHRYYIELNNTSLQPLLVRWGTSTESAFAFARRNTEDSNSTRYLINGANIGSPLGDGVGGLRFRWNANVGLTFNNAKIIPQIFDLTEMFGTEKAEEIYQMEVNEVGSGVAYFRSLFPLSYYSYNQGSLLSFNGNGIKTVGFNQWDEQWEVGAYQSASGQKTDSVRDRIRSKNPIRIFPSTNYYVSKGLQFYYYDANMNFLLWNNFANPTIITTPSNACYMNFNGLANSGTTYNNDICISISSSRNGEYEPYTSSTLSLPISTYFPNGMDGVGSDYDELTNTKAYHRMARVDLGTLSYSYESTQIFFYATIPDIVGGMTSATKPNVIIPGYSFKGETVGWANMGNLTYGFTGRQIRIKNESYTTVDSFKQAINGTKIVYPLATPIETSFTAASLVTENAEIPLSNEDGVLVGKCTEQLSENPGFIDAKIKLSDADGECYSNKIQLHVERSPQ